MRIQEHNLDSLRKAVRDLQKENAVLKELLDKHNISYESRSVLEEQPLPDEYDEDQGGRILPYEPTKELAQEFFSFFWGAQTFMQSVAERAGIFRNVRRDGMKRYVLRPGMRRLFVMRIAHIRHGSLWNFG